MADPGELAAKLIQENFPKFGSFRKDAVYQVTGDDVVDPVAGTSTHTILAEYPLMLIRDVATGSLLQAAGVADDDPVVKKLRVAIFPALDLPVKPKDRDFIKIEGVRWLVLGDSPDPQPAIHQLVIKPYDNG